MLSARPAQMPSPMETALRAVVSTTTNQFCTTVSVQMHRDAIEWLCVGCIRNELRVPETIEAKGRSEKGLVQYQGEETRRWILARQFPARSTPMVARYNRLQRAVAPAGGAAGSARSAPPRAARSSS